MTITGTIGDLIFYQVDGKTRVRTKPKGMGKRLKEDPSYAEARARNHDLVVANAIATCIYRVAKEYASSIDHKKHNELVKRIYHVVKQHQHPFNWEIFGNAIKGLYLNYRDTSPIVDIGRYKDQLILNYNSKRIENVAVRVYVCTLPLIFGLDEGEQLPTDMEHVEELQFTTLKGEEVGTETLPIDVKPDQVVIVKSYYYWNNHHYEWLRVV